jgi:hypothetical protein
VVFDPSNKTHQTAGNKINNGKLSLGSEGESPKIHIDDSEQYTCKSGISIHATNNVPTEDMVNLFFGLQSTLKIQYSQKNSSELISKS